MKVLASCFLFAVIAGLGFAAPDPTGAAAPLTAKEIGQGFRDHVILARPLPAHRATVDAAEVREGVRVREKFARFGDLRVVDLDSGDSPNTAIERLRATGRYEFVEPDYVRHTTALPNDPQFTNGALWELNNTGQSGGVAGADIKATAAWDIIHDAPNVIVAVVDTGVNLNHQDIAANLWTNPAPTFGDIHGARFLNGAQSGDPTDDGGHGTHVAGTIGAVGNNGVASVGIAWKVQIMAVKVFPGTGSGSVSDIAKGVNYAIAHGAQIINASYGEGGSTGFSFTELAAITAAHDAGIIFVAAAGNDTADMDVTRFYPASHALDNIVAVGSSTRRDELSTFSNYGSAVELVAPGEEIVSLNYANNTGVIEYSGTSMAAPHVTGTLALLKAHFPGDNYRQLINRLLRGVDPVSRFAGKTQTGGRLNLLNALNTTTNRPFNDDFASRPHYNTDNLALRSNNAGATAEGGEPAIIGNAPSATLWWEWTAPETGSVSVDTSGSAYDTLLAIYTGTSLGTLVPVASNDNDSINVTSRVTFTAQAGTTYEIAVDGRNGASGLTLLNLGTTPANDAFASPVVLAGQSSHLTATNSHCSRESGEPRILGFAGGTSLWYRWTAPRTGRFQVSAVSTDFDPILAVYTGTAVNALTLVSSNDNLGADNGSLCSIDAVAGTTYMITVDSKTATAVGQFTLSLVDSLWQAATTDAITGAPAVAPDGTIYVGSTDDSLYAFTPSGTQKWSAATGSIIDTSSPTVADDGTVYVGSYDGKLYAYNPDGSQKWTHSFASSAASNSPALAPDGTIYIKPADGSLYAIDPTTGNTKWSKHVNAPVSYASPAVAPDGTIYVGSEDHNLYAFNPDGSTKWTFAGDNDIYTVPAIDSAGNLYFSVLNTGKLFSVSPDGRQRWAYSGASLGSSSSAALSPDGNTVYFGGYDHKLHAVDAATGTVRWTYTLGDEIRASSPAVDANGVVYIGCYDFRLYAVNPDGTPTRTYDTGNWIRSCPAIFGNTLYVGSNDHKLYAFALGTGSAGGPWPQYRNNPRRTGRAASSQLAITVAPQSQVAVLGLSLSLNVTAAGPGPLAYQWSKDGAPISGATNPILSVANVTASTAGTYTVVVSNSAGAVTSAPAVVSIQPITPGRLINLSVRTGAGTGVQTLTVGFALAGTSNKPILIRAVGPSLAQFGISGVLSDPILQLYGDSALALDSNDNWSTPTDGTAASTLAATFASTGAFSLGSGSKDAALLRALSAGTYTAQVTGADGTGIALAELYDTDPANGARLINVSARAQVNTGDGVLVAGFTISGNVKKTVLIRGIGPSLASFGVTGVLANPRLDVYQDATLIQGNDDWGGGAALSTAFSQAGAFSLTTASSRDAAMLVNLAPGSYTAQVSGVNGTTGVALVEVYELP